MINKYNINIIFILVIIFIGCADSIEHNIPHGFEKQKANNPKTLKTHNKLVKPPENIPLVNGKEESKDKKNTYIIVDRRILCLSLFCVAMIAILAFIYDICRIIKYSIIYFKSK